VVSAPTGAARRRVAAVSCAALLAAGLLLRSAAAQDLRSVYGGAQVPLEQTIPPPGSYVGPNPPVSDPRVTDPRLTNPPVGDPRVTDPRLPAANAWVAPGNGSPDGPAPVIQNFSTANGGGWLAGAGIYYLQPRWGNNPANSTAVSSQGNVATAETGTQQDFSMSGQFAPLIWLGYVGEGGMGLRARWWHLQGTTKFTTDLGPNSDPNTSTSIFTAYPLGVGFSAASSSAIDNAMEFDSSLTMDVTDLEFLWDLRPRRGSLLLGAGIRYAHLNQSYHASLLSTPTDPTQDVLGNDLAFNHNFDGIGPLLSLEARYPLGETGFSLLGSVRGAVLIGNGSQQATMTSTDNSVVQDTITRWQPGGGTIPVLELELGAGWQTQVNRYQFQVEAAAVAQAWFTAGNAANQDNIFSSPFSPDASTRDTLGLIGFRLTAGLSY
jgi:hypothetical protein